MDILFYVLSSLAVLITITAWYKVTALRKRVPGGIVKATCNRIGEFTGLLAAGFLAFRFFPLLPEESKLVLESLVFICAASFAIVIINFLSELAADHGF